MNIKEIAKSKNYVINTFYLKALLKQKLTLNELVLFLYFLNNDTTNFVPSKISKETSLSKEDVLSSFDGLLSKNILTIVTSKDSDGRISEEISLDSFYKSVSDGFQVAESASDNRNLISSVEGILDKKITKEEELIICSWLDLGYSSATILDAFKEAKYNGMVNLRYIDKVLSEWKQKGIKDTKEAGEYIRENSENKNVNLFDYDWLNEE